MRLRGGLFALALLAAPAAANQASWPIIVSVTYPAGLTAGAGVARVDVLLDGMRAGNDNIVRVTRDQATAGARIDFDAPFHPGPGRSSLVVSAKAAFAGAGAGVTVLSFPYGAENADQLAEHSACVRQGLGAAPQFPLALYVGGPFPSGAKTRHPARARSPLGNHVKLSSPL